MFGGYTVNWTRSSKLLSADQDCGDQLLLLAAIRGGINGRMGGALENHIRFHLTEGANEQVAPELANDLIDLVFEST